MKKTKFLCILLTLAMVLCISVYADTQVKNGVTINYGTSLSSHSGGGYTSVSYAGDVYVTSYIRLRRSTNGEIDYIPVLNETTGTSVSVTKYLGDEWDAVTGRSDHRAYVTQMAWWSETSYPPESTPAVICNNR